MLEIIREHERLEKIQREWDDLAGRWGNPLFTHSWSAAAARAFCRGDNLAVAVLWNEGRIRAIAPLAQSAGFVGRQHILGHRLMEPGALLYEDEACLAELTRSMRARGAPLALARLRAEGAEARAFRQGLNRHGFTLTAPTGTSMAAVLPAGSADIEATMTSKAVSKVKRKLRKAQQRGALAFEAIVPEAGASSQYIDQLIEIEAAGWKGRNGTAIASVPGYAAFFHDYGRRECEAGRLRIFRALLDGDVIATRLAVTAGSSLFELKIAFDERYQELSPGLLLTHETLRAASLEGLERHEFLGVSEDWQALWPTEQRRYFSVRHYPYSLRGGAALIEDIGGRATRQVAQRAHAFGQRIKLVSTPALACSWAGELVNFIH